MNEETAVESLMGNDKSTQDIEVVVELSSPEKHSADTLQVDSDDDGLSGTLSRITVEEIAPKSDNIADDLGPRQSCSRYRLREKNHDMEVELDKKIPRNVRRYYKHQKRLADAFEDNLSSDGESDSGGAGDKLHKKAITRIVLMSLICNVLLLIGKAVASYLSGSLAIISSLVDSAVDLASSLIFWYTNRAIKVTNFYEYPAGKTRLEPVAVIILSVIMTVASIQLIITSVTTIINGSADPDISIATIIIIVLTVVIKFFLFIFAKRVNSPSTNALSQDHRNDILSNACALGFGYMGYKLWKNADPVGAILISLYIAFGWWRTGSQQVRSLTGHTAQPELLQRLLWVCMHHDNRVQFIDTLRAYHFGNHLLVEAHIVLPPSMTLQEAHDIGEPLQQKLEKFPNVERAFVHIDYEYEHNPLVEHKMGGQTPIK